MIILYGNRTVTLSEYIKIRNKLLLRAKSRTKNFNDNYNNYYWYRLKTLDETYPEFKSIGIINTKENL